MYDFCHGNLTEEEKMLIEDLLSHLDAKVRHFNRIRAGLFRNNVDNVKKQEQRRAAPSAPRCDTEEIQRFVEKLNGNGSGNGSNLSGGNGNGSMNIAAQQKQESKPSLGNGSNRSGANGSMNIAAQQKQERKPSPAELLEEMLESSRGSKPDSSGQTTFENESAPSVSMSATPAGTFSGTNMGSYTAPAETVKKEKTPEDVVRTYIEAWNTRSFNSEYKCLGGAMAMIPEKEYISRRYQTYHESNGNNVIQQLEKITENNIVGSEARMKCKKVQLEGNRKKVFLEDYVLNKDGGDWRIVSVRSRQF
jgi:hypothetical protein